MTVIQLVVIISNTICSKSSFIVSKTSGVARLAMKQKRRKRDFHRGKRVIPSLLNPFAILVMYTTHDQLIIITLLLHFNS